MAKEDEKEIGFVPVEDPEEPEKQVQEEKPPELILGKFKTVEELQKGYTELEKKLGDPARVQEDKPEDQAWADAPDAPAPQPGSREYWDERFSTDYVGATAELVSLALRQDRQTERAATANVRRALASKAGEPFFAQIKDDMEADLLELDPALLANPAGAKAIADRLFDANLGKYARSRLTAAGDPVKARRALENLGVEAPEAEDVPERRGREVERDGDAALRELGLSKAAREKVKEKWESAEEDE